MGLTNRGKFSIGADGRHDTKPDGKPSRTIEFGADGTTYGEVRPAPSPVVLPGVADVPKTTQSPTAVGVDMRRAREDRARAGGRR